MYHVIGPKRLTRMLHALSSVARLSVGMSMSPFSPLTRHASESCIHAIIHRVSNSSTSHDQSSHLSGGRRATYSQGTVYKSYDTSVDEDQPLRPPGASSLGTKVKEIQATRLCEVGNKEVGGKPPLASGKPNSRLSRSMENVSVLLEALQFRNGSLGPRLKHSYSHIITIDLL